MSDQPQVSRVTLPLKTIAAVLLFFGGLAAATLYPLWTESGWPMNHEGGLFLLRTQVYARHLSWFDLAPIWSSADAQGFGSPFPLMYHKLFYLIAGALANVTGSLKTADATAVWLLLIIGATGLFLLVRTMGGSVLAAAVAGSGLITANYTITNWMVRGALAELSAAMVIPWVLFYYSRTLQTGTLALGLGIATGVLWLGHSVVAFFTALLLALTYFALAVAGAAPWSVLRPKTAWPAVVGLGAIVAPYLLVMTVVTPLYDFSRILSHPYTPADQFRPLRWYFWNGRWHWGQTWTGYTVALDLAILVTLLVAGAILLVRAWRGHARWSTAQPAVPLLITAACAIFLQSRSSAWVYAWVPGAQFIQFPWRLLALITPALIAAAVYLLDRTPPRAAARVALVTVAVWMIVACGAFASRKYGQVWLGPGLEGMTFSSEFREYEPRIAPPVPELREQLAMSWQDAGCSLAARTRTSDEVPVAEYEAVCSQSTVVAFPLYASPLHRVRTGEGEHARPCAQSPRFPSLCAVSVPAGRSVVAIELPSLGSAVGRILWTRLAFWA